ncbi:restriction endonuclease [Paraglaciecola marina]|uniref:restriction endonuclease n=1 Tax=Paraglaciecola marina TaxID=2500157 RepID=UPI00106108E9|nr:restriction endonuclease [Paraglaciecola marina]
MEKVTASNLAKAIDGLDKSVAYDYPHEKTHTKIKVVDVKRGEGPVTIKRWNPLKGSYENAKIVTISVQALWRMANAIEPGRPINVDRVFGASYNSRSALEALLLHTEFFYLCYPGRLEKMGENTKVKTGHKHLIYLPDEPHKKGVITELEKSEIVVTQVDRELHFDALHLTEGTNRDKAKVEIDRRHAQIQLMLIKIAESFGLHSWVARNDQGIKYNGQSFIEMNSVVKKLVDAAALQGYRKAATAGDLIDLIWLSKDGKKIPAVIEIEHSTGVTSGLTRMKSFKTEAPELAHMTYIIAAPDEIRSQVVRKSLDPQFQDMDIKYLSYSSIEDMYLLSRRKIQGIDNIKFLHTFLEPTKA